ncbi:pyruvate kinase [Acidithiobacillus thiooxidans]|uniref:Pyruvate kinase n=1 Tax=Acidithiobacillus thiooxidans ATCC 19377 TaxID=637390 RepID=A0A543Q2H6_ACITH|nr:pyruvate kinase [Acidithiobacillus thiooxidans]MDR7927587.1 pyruvate kinase [Acidithiobacillus thiooxidans]MDX5935340.1 pyruvate kinase [Acidithiobacillus thiooxidans]TQN50525.1 Pyruvate kinase [Acidithiobacillus thiooxidans ATCC 19377]
MKLPKHRSKIVCTIGPASDAPNVLEQMIRAGMNVARLNLAHGTPDEHRARIARIRDAAHKTGYRVAILADLPGPKIRIGSLPAPVTLKHGDHVLLAPGAPGTAQAIPLELPPLAKPLVKGDTVYLNDGFLELRVEQHDHQGVLCQVIVGGVLLSHKGVNLPGVYLEGGALTAADRELLGFALEAGVDGLSVSFVESAEDLHAARHAANALGFHPFLVAKIERARAWKHIDAIIDATDAIMVARGDLGVEVPIEEIAIIQKRLIRKTRAVGKSVITATQMLESMVHNRRPTRAEVTDVANAILDGTDCIMLSEESAMGDFPVEAVKMLAEIARVTEKNRAELNPLSSIDLDDKPGVESIIASNVRHSAERLNPLFVVTPTETGTTAARIARFRLEPWILAISPHTSTCQRLCLHYGVYPIEMPSPESGWEEAARRWLLTNAVEKGLILLTQGPSKGHPGGTNRLEIIHLDVSATQ